MHNPRALKQSKLSFKSASASNILPLIIIDSPRRKSVSDLTTEFESDPPRAKSQDRSDRKSEHTNTPQLRRSSRTCVDKSNTGPKIPVIKMPSAKDTPPSSDATKATATKGSANSKDKERIDQISVTEKPGEKTKPEGTPGATPDPLSTPNNKQLLEAISCLGANLRNDMSELRAEHKPVVICLPLRSESLVPTTLSSTAQSVK